MSKLKLGKMSGRELAEWLGISYEGTYRKNPTRHLKKLEDYCEYEQVRGGAIIKKIYVEEYDKNLRTNNDKLYVKELKQCNYLASVSGMAQKYEVSAYSLRKSRDRLFGEEATNIALSSETQGLIGSREFVWAIKLEGNNNYRYMTEEEEQLFNGLITQVYGSADPDDVKKQSLILETCVKKNLSAAQYQKMITVHGCNFFSQVVEKFKIMTGKMIVKATRHELSRNFDLSDQEQQYADMLLDYHKNLGPESE